MRQSDVHTQSVYAFVREGIELLDTLEDALGQLRDFAYTEALDANDNVTHIELVTDDGAVFRITVERIA
jgi:hypothetical protein